MTTRPLLLEAARPRALDLHPRLARAVDTLSALHDADGASAFAQIALRVDIWASSRAVFATRGASRFMPCRPAP